MVTNYDLFESLTLFEWLLKEKGQCVNKTNCYHLDMTKGQGRILSILSLEDSISTKELARKAGLNVSSVNEILSKLEKKDLVKRYPKPNDKRVIINSLTNLAKENAPAKPDYNFLNCLNKEQKKNLLEILSILNKELEKDIIDSNEEDKRKNWIDMKTAFISFLEKNRETV